MNSVILVGRLVKEPELRKGACQFSLAVKRNYKNSEGEYDTDFINCVAFSQLAENLEKYADKGDFIAVRGRIQVSQYEDKDGKNSYATEVIVDSITFLSSKK